MRYTRQLFWEQQALLPTEMRKIEPMYTLYEDKGDLPNFRKLYVQMGDPTGYALAQAYLEDYSHWNLLMKSAWFREAKEVWDAELDAKLKSEAMTAIRQLANGGDEVPIASQLNAAKYLANGEHRKAQQAKPVRGRPSKEEVTGNLKQMSADEASIADDLKRIRSVS